MWKGCATAAAVRTAVFAAELAAEGDGAGQPLRRTGRTVAAPGVEAPKWEALGGAKPFRITATSFKAYPSVVHTQGPIGLVLDLRQRVGTAEIESVHVATYGEAVRRTATEAEKWDPKTRETADHSIPYLVAAAFQDGGVTPATFRPSRVQDPALRPLIKKLKVVEEPEFTRRYPAESCTRIEVTTTDGGGRRRRRAIRRDTTEPADDGEVEAKFRGLASGALGVEGCDRVLAEVWELENSATLDRLFESLVISRRRTS